MLAGVASAYQNATDSGLLTAAQPQPQTRAVSDTIPSPTPFPTEVQPVNWTPEEAAALAAQVLGHDDLYSVEISDLNGETVYVVTFSSGDLVYVSLDGQIRSIGKVPVETVIVNSGNGRGGGGGGTANSNQGREDHDDHEEHEGHEEHDDD
jgi:hypothetical protein